MLAVTTSVMQDLRQPATHEQMKSTVEADYEQQLASIVTSSERLMEALRAVRSLGLSSWCIGAGAIRSTVWDFLHGFVQSVTSDDIDVAYFDAAAPSEHEADMQERLHSLIPTLHWEVTNQAHVHHWFANTLGLVVPPLACLEDGLATWPEYATCVGVYMEPDDSLTVIAPHGLADLFEMRVRHNPRRASASTYLHRVQSKQFSQRWPRLSIIT